MKLYTFLNQMKIGENICSKDDKMNSLNQNPKWKKNMRIQKHTGKVRKYRKYVARKYNYNNDLSKDYLPEQ